MAGVLENGIGMADVLENGIGMENIWNGNKQLWLFDLLKNKTGQQKNLKSGNAKSVGRVNGFRAGCEYGILLKLTTRANKCVNGAKSVNKPGCNSRWQ